LSRALRRKNYRTARPQTIPRQGQILVALAKGQQDAPAQPRIFIADDEIDQAVAQGFRFGGCMSLDLAQGFPFFGFGFQIQQTRKACKVFFGSWVDCRHEKVILTFFLMNNVVARKAFVFSDEATA
jgi:hypothetical protein